MVAQTFIAEGACATQILKLVGISRSTYYYRTSEGTRGRASSTHTQHTSGAMLPNALVVDAIQWLLTQEFVDYGYVKVTRCLQRQGLVINAKKVYRLMREHNLLLPKPSRDASGKVWVKDLLPATKQPFDYLEFDIKFVRIDGTGRNAMMLTIIDVMSHYTLGFLLQYSVKSEDVIALFDDVFARYATPSTVRVRSDNGSQFASTIVRKYFKKLNITQEFIRPATPDMNAHIEGYHSVVQRAVCDRISFEDLEDGQRTFERFHRFYNFERLHSGIGYIAPAEKLRAMNVNVSPTSSIPMNTCQVFEPQLQEFLS